MAGPLGKPWASGRERALIVEPPVPLSSANKMALPLGCESKGSSQPSGSELLLTNLMVSVYPGSAANEHQKGHLAMIGTRQWAPKSRLAVVGTRSTGHRTMAVMDPVEMLPEDPEGVMGRMENGKRSQRHGIDGFSVCSSVTQLSATILMTSHTHTHMHTHAHTRTHNTRAHTHTHTHTHTHKHTHTCTTFVLA